MLSLSLPVRIFLCVLPTDMRRGFDGLMRMAEEHLQQNVLDGGLFVFVNRRRDRVKLLYWDGHPSRTPCRIALLGLPAQSVLIGASAPIIPPRRVARMCAARFNRRDTAPRRHFEPPSTIVARSTLPARCDAGMSSSTTT